MPSSRDPRAYVRPVPLPITSSKGQGHLCQGHMGQGHMINCLTMLSSRAFSNHLCSRTTMNVDYKHEL